MDRKDHWNDVYRKRKADEVSWFQERPILSLRMIESSVPEHNAAIIDVGGGTSRLVDCLVADGYENVSVLDISGEALHHAQGRLGAESRKVRWIEGDVTEFNSGQKFRFWHDRAVFHFLTKPEEVRRYLAVMGSSLDSGAFAMIATFAPDGPEKCSGLFVQRYSHESLQEILGLPYEMLRKEQEVHLTPSGVSQKFIYTLFKKI